MKEIKLGDLFLVKGGSVDPAKFPEETFEYFSIPAYDKGTPEIIKGSGIGSSKKLFQPNDILLSRIVPHIRRCWVVGSSNGKRQIGSGEWITFRSDKIIPEFLRFYLMSDEFNAKFLKTVKGVGGSLLRADPQQVAKFSINLPPLEQQKKIAAILDAADAYRQKTKALIAKYDELTQSLFLDMFGDPVKNEKGWEQKELGTLLEITSSKRIFKEEYVDNGVPFFRTKEIVELSKGNKISLELYISEKRYNEIKQKFEIPEIGDILMSAVGTIGVMWTVDTQKPFYFKDGNLVWLKSSKLEDVNSTYLKMTLNYLIEYEKDKLAEGGAYNALTIAKLNLLKVLIAPVDIQNQFAERVQAIEQQKAQAQASLEKAEEMFNSLLQRAFKGELV